MREFSAAFQTELMELLKWRRDVRHFKTDPIPLDLLQKCLNAFQTSPSVGLSEPWRIVRITSPERRAQALDNFTIANADALRGYSDERAKTYASLKLSGMRDAPEQLAIFCDESTLKGAGLGAQSMPEMRRYSVVAAIMNFWLVTRANGLGLGWVSILDPEQLRRDLDVSNDWALVAYLCVGWPEHETLTPELETVGWETRAPEITLIEK
ncbi:5,6-dimethylbenzimidazole synthase [Amylibacter ulvae]|uniref:5,6-dimethylbenzimidazole synthase n=1 Tax=Paramylibacter ulvae TaxID=1651968 RepID=A0ABQ3D463_9RHOB|nr:5,6-dimethylbenzimidazole synthase [Amylibacter ulvae]GHA57747.1 5,6-dimethylbenzimidazole synthase [Amylibacter ulvae]